MSIKKAIAAGHICLDITPAFKSKEEKNIKDLFRPGQLIAMDATHKIVGTEFQYRKMKKGNEELEAWLSRMLSPRINFRFFEVPMDEGMVVLMEIPCAEKQPVQFAGGEFIRIGTNKKNLKEYPDKERELWRTFDSTPYELRIAMGNLDEDEMVLLLDYSKYYDKLEMPIPRNRDKVLEDLQHEKFIKRNDAGAVDGGYIKVMDPDTAPRYKKYIPYWA